MSHQPEHPPADTGDDAQRPEGDHRRLGRELGIFTTSDALGAGLPIWLPDGAVLRHTLEQYVRDLERRAGYDHVYSPPLARQDLYERSGHWEHYAESMFAPMPLGAENVVLRPMNCPHHILVYAHRQRSHRELPVRIAECGQMFRNELSGAVGGLSRVRCMTLNDGHVFAHPDQIGAEVAAILELISGAHRDLGITAAAYRLSRRGNSGKYVTGDGTWDRAEAALAEALGAAGVEWYAAEDEAAFYGPKIDIQVQGHSGREETLSTVQLDFTLPERFELTYVDADGERRRPVMIHRSIISTFERIVAFLLEVHDGNLPLWLAPRQVHVVPVTDDHNTYAHQVRDLLEGAGLRAHVDAGGPLGPRVHNARQLRVPCTVVVGDREAAGNSVSVRARGQRRAGSCSVDELAARLAADNAARVTTGW